MTVKFFKNSKQVFWFAAIERDFSATKQYAKIYQANKISLQGFIKR